jgi:hypothetical protein
MSHETDSLCLSLFRKLVSALGENRTQIDVDDGDEIVMGLLLSSSYCFAFFDARSMRGVVRRWWM